jgi:hypothetical protein
LFFGTFASAQGFVGSHYSTTGPATSFSDNTSNCVVGKTQCWKQISTRLGILATARQMAVTVDGTAFAVGTDQKLYQYANNAWQVNPSAPTGVAGVAAASSTDIYVITNPNGLLYHYDGTSWTSLGIEAVNLSEGSDGTIYIQQGIGSFQLETLSSGTWTQVPIPSGHGVVTVFSVGAKNNVWLKLQDNTLWSLDPSSGTFVGVTPPSGTTAPAIVCYRGSSSQSGNLADHSKQWHSREQCVPVQRFNWGMDSDDRLAGQHRHWRPRQDGRSHVRPANYLPFQRSQVFGIRNDNRIL